MAQRQSAIMAKLVSSNIRERARSVRIDTEMHEAGGYDGYHRDVRERSRTKDAKMSKYARLLAERMLRARLRRANDPRLAKREELLGPI